MLGGCSGKRFKHVDATWRQAGTRDLVSSLRAVFFIGAATDQNL